MEFIDVKSIKLHELSKSEYYDTRKSIFYENDNYYCLNLNLRWYYCIKNINNILCHENRNNKCFFK